MRITGTGVALVTPFNPDHSVDYTGLQNLISHVSTGGVDFLVVMGTTGESVTLTQNEKSEILQFVESNNAGLPIVLGIGGNNTQAVIDTIKNTGLSHVEAVLSVTPAYNRPSQQGIIAHFQAIADVCPVPIILYNVPSRTGSDMSVASILELAKHEYIVGIKEASGNIEKSMAIARNKPNDFHLLSGDDMLTGTLYGLGAIGVISVLANALPKMFNEISEAGKSGDIIRSNKICAGLLEMNPLMYEESNPTGIKALLNIMGLMSNHLRMPLQAASEDLQERIRAAYKNLPE